MKYLRILTLVIIDVLYFSNSLAYDFEVDGLCYNILTSNTVEVTGGSSYSGTIQIPEKVINNGIEYTVTAIGDNAFSYCYNLTGSLTIPSTITHIGTKAFYNCTNLKGSLTIPNSVKTIGDYAFYGCERFDATLSLPSSIKVIGNYVFYGCRGFFNRLIIPQSVTSIGDYAFCGCSGLTGSLTIPNSVTSIGKNAFAACKNLTGSLTLSNVLEIIGENAFASCGFKGSLTIPNSVTSIGNNAFSGCSGLSSVIIGYSVTSIGREAFSYCRGLTSISIPNSVTSIGESAFRDCSGLASITIPNSVTSIGNFAFSGCRGLASITIPNSVTSIGREAFYYCSSLPSVTIPNSVTSIGGSAFSECSSLTSVTIGSGIKTIYDNAFASCPKLTDVYCYAVNVPNTYTNVFLDSNIEYATLHVPAVSVNAYKAAYLWKNFKAIIGVGETSTYTLSIKSLGSGSVLYDGITIKNQTSTFTVNEGTSATITFSPDNGYRIKSVKLNSTNVTSSVSNNQYTISNINTNTTLEVEFEAIPVTKYSLSITATGNGSATYDGTAVRSRTTSFTVNEGTDVTITFSPDNGNSIASVKLNNSDVTSQVSGNRYTINNITANTTLTVTFQEDVNAMTVDGVNYTVVSQADRTVKVTGGDFGQVLTVPATVTQNGKTWTVIGIDANALKNNTELAAVIWNPTYNFTAMMSNPNLLLYVKAEQYAPSSIQNVVVNGTASNIVLKETSSGNDFYCPQAFVAQKISYTHNYQMQTGDGESKGWETIALPFDVQTITHETKGTIVPFAQWNNSSNKKPFWLMELTGTGFVEAGSIKAYTPYIISMPNNPQYDNQWLLKGKVTFAASSVTVGKTENLNQPVYNGRTFIPCFTERKADEGFYALNVSNDWETNNSGMTEGSKFVLNMRRTHPFEAYMASSSNAAPYFDVFDDMTTGIQVMDEGRWMKEEAVYDLQGRKVENPSMKGVYIVNGKKMIIK